VLKQKTPNKANFVKGCNFYPKGSVGKNQIMSGDKGNRTPVLNILQKLSTCLFDFSLVVNQQNLCALFYRGKLLPPVEYYHQWITIIWWFTTICSLKQLLTLQRSYM